MKDPMDTLLKQALSPAIEPSTYLNNRVKGLLMTRQTAQPRWRLKLAPALVASFLIFTVAVGALAASSLLKAPQVVEHLGYPVLAEAFAADGALEINESVVSGDYRFTLLGLTSGQGLRGLDQATQALQPERTYAVVAIEKQDGTPMPSPLDPAYDDGPRFVSPFIKGQQPWRVNIFTLRGASSIAVVDGVMYHLVDFDAIEKFADRGVYLAVSTSSFDAFEYDEATGVVSLAPNYSGAHALFELPLDPSKADQAAAQQYLDELLLQFEQSKPWGRIEPDLTLPPGQVIPESVQALTPDADGTIHYSFDGFEVTMSLTSLERLFAEGKTFVMTAKDSELSRAVEISQDDSGTIIGSVYVLD